MGGSDIGGGLVGAAAFVLTMLLVFGAERGFGWLARKVRPTRSDGPPELPPVG